MASKPSSGTGRSSKGAAQGSTGASTRGAASTTPKSAVSSSRGATQGFTRAPSAPKDGAASAQPKSAAASGGKPVSRNEVYKAWGGAQNFAHSHGLRLHNHEDVQEMKDIADAVARNG